MIWQKLEIIYLQRIDYTKKYEKKKNFIYVETPVYLSDVERSIRYLNPVSHR